MKKPSQKDIEIKRIEKYLKSQQKLGYTVDEKFLTSYKNMTLKTLKTYNIEKIRKKLSRDGLSYKDYQHKVRSEGGRVGAIKTNYIKKVKKIAEKVSSYHSLDTEADVIMAKQAYTRKLLQGFQERPELFTKEIQKLQEDMRVIYDELYEAMTKQDLSQSSEDDYVYFEGDEEISSLWDNSYDMFTKDVEQFGHVFDVPRHEYTEEELYEILAQKDKELLEDIQSNADEYSTYEEDIIDNLSQRLEDHPALKGADALRKMLEDEIERYGRDTVARGLSGLGDNFIEEIDKILFYEETQNKNDAHHSLVVLAEAIKSGEMFTEAEAKSFGDILDEDITYYPE